MFNNGNQMVEIMLKVIKNDDSTSNNVSILNQDKVQNVRLQNRNLLSKVGLYGYNEKQCIQIVENILDNGIDDSTPAECLDYLTAERYLDLPKENMDTKATGELGLSYILSEANAIIKDMKNAHIANKVSKAFNYLDLVDGNYLNTNDEDAIYFNSNHKLATVRDIYKEFNNSINYLKSITNNKISE